MPSRRAAREPVLSEGDFGYLRELVHASAGIVIEPEKGYLVDVRLGALLRRLGLQEPMQLIALLRGDGAEELRRQTVEAFANGETLFFRDIALFEALATRVLPQLIEARRAQRRLHIWSAACSTGQEPYSLAMLLADRFPELVGWQVELVATDLSLESLARARRGVYTQFEVNRGLPAQMLVRHFSQRDGEWILSPAITQRVQLRPLNLLRDPPPLYPIDLVLLRNAMIYWDLPTKRSVLGKLREAMRPDGALVLGAAENTLELEDLFTRVAHPGASSYAPTIP